MNYIIKKRNYLQQLFCQILLTPIYPKNFVIDFEDLLEKSTFSELFSRKENSKNAGV